MHAANKSQRALAAQPVSLRRLTVLSMGLLIGAAAVHSAQANAWGFFDRSVNGSGTISSTTRTASGIQAVDVSLPANVRLVQGEAEGLVIKTDDNIAPLVETNVERGRLSIRSAKGVSLRTKVLDITVFIKSVDALSIAGSGNIQSAALQAPALKLRISGSGDMQLNGLAVGDLNVSIAGSGSVEGAGKADSLDGSIAGSGDIKLKHLATGKANIHIAGSGDAVVWAQSKLAISIAGSGDVRYYGNPSVTHSVAGSGSVQSMGEKP